MKSNFDICPWWGHFGCFHCVVETIMFAIFSYFLQLFKIFILKFVWVQASWASLNYPRDNTDVLAGWISSGCKRLAVSCVHLQPRLNCAIVSESKYFDTAASRDTLTPDKRERSPTGVKMCPVLSEHPRSGQPGGPAQTDRSFTAWTACMHLWALQDWRALRDLSHTREE